MFTSLWCKILCFFPRMARNVYFTRFTVVLYLKVEMTDVIIIEIF
jgi:hypothetical protein